MTASTQVNVNAKIGNDSSSHGRCNNMENWTFPAVFPWWGRWSMSVQRGLANRRNRVHSMIMKSWERSTPTMSHKWNRFRWKVNRFQLFSHHISCVDSIRVGSLSKVELIDRWPKWLENFSHKGILSKFIPILRGAFEVYTIPVYF